MQRLEIKKPGKAGRCRREAEEQPLSAADGGKRLPFAEIADPEGKHEHDHHRADEGGKIAVDALQSSLGENGSKGGKKRGE